MKYKFIANGFRWFDKVNGNTYHSVNVTNNETGETIYHEMTYGYEDQYRQTALEIMLEKGWIPKEYGERKNGSSRLYLYERENDYPIYWNVTNGLKRDCIKNGKP